MANATSTAITAVTMLLPILFAAPMDTFRLGVALGLGVALRLGVALAVTPPAAEVSSAPTVLGAGLTITELTLDNVVLVPTIPFEEAELEEDAIKGVGTTVAVDLDT
jgi:hypothetical protein